MPPRILSTIAFILLVAAAAIAEDFECSASTVLSGHEYDLTSLNAAKSVERTRNTPPTTMIDTLVFNICSELESKDLPAGDQVRIYGLMWLLRARFIC
jgi:autophagy-related protein 27